MPVSALRHPSPGGGVCRCHTNSLCERDGVARARHLQGGQWAAAQEPGGTDLDLDPLSARLGAEPLAPGPGQGPGPAVGRIAIPGTSPGTALARNKLLVALWRYVQHGVPVDGAVMRA